MLFSDLDIKISYESGRDNPLHDFYIPVLNIAQRYDRVSGFFSSKSLAIAAKGIAGLIGNGGKMRLIASPHISAYDYDIIKETCTSLHEYIETRFIDELKIEEIEDGLMKNHLRAMGWMLSQGLLEIKLAIVKDIDSDKQSEGLFHEKFGILEDIGGNIISFSGSINETASAWLNNIEEFKVFKGWIEGQSDFLKEDINKFDNYWNGINPHVNVVPITDAVREKLIKISRDFDPSVIRLYKTTPAIRKKSVEENLDLFDYQKEAVDMWKQNGHKLLFEMATGTGKTRTAIACIHEALKANSRLITIISCPQNTLSRQWNDEIKKIGLSFSSVIIADGTNSKWRNETKDDVIKIKLGYYNNILIFTTHDTGCSPDFIEFIANVPNHIPLCFVGDEVHGLGALNAKKGLIENYTYRIGLSATPKRWFDDFGTSIIENFFGNKSFEFTIFNALNTINPKTTRPFLVNFEYYPIFIKLDDVEFEEYLSLSQKISKLASCSKGSDEYLDMYERMLFKRAKILKDASEKYQALIDIINDIQNKGDFRDTFIFVSDKQINPVMKILFENRIIAHRFTQDQGTDSEKQYGGLSQRQYLLKLFKEGQYQALVAIKCLDEGIDIPGATTAILMASSTNPREYIQRTGRVIRQSENKPRAYIYDLIVEPSIERIHNPEFKEFEKKIFEKEMIRVEDMSLNAINNASVYQEISKIRKRFI